ncbi:MAG: nucleoside hydrolase [Ferruginibacter sp.]|nr:nucleoside hydrolase [Chitinophagaceae bacterium]
MISTTNGSLIKLLYPACLFLLLFGCAPKRINNNTDEAGSASTNDSSKNKAIKLILDSDIGQDCDDAGVMALMHKFADFGEVEILATMFPMQDPMGAPAMDVINTFYGRPDIPVGTYKGSFKYLGQLHDHYNTKLAKNFPHDLKHGNDAPDAIDLYRKILATQKDNSVVIVAVGPERLLADLLNSGPDSYSNLSGRELVKKKVKLLSLMGSGFPKDQEWNIKIAPDAAKLVAETWPTPVVYSGNEIGKAVRTGSRLLSETPENNPVRASFEGHPFVDKTTKDRESWDQTAMLYAIRGLQDFWTVENNGYNFIDEAGKNEWRRDVDKDHSYLVMKNAATVKKVIEDLMVAAPGNKQR